MLFVYCVSMRFVCALSALCKRTVPRSMRLSPLGRRRNRPAGDVCVVGRPRGAVRIFRRLQQAAYRSGQRVGRQLNIPLAERLADRIRDRAELPERYLLAQTDVEKSGPFHILDLCGAPIDMRRGRSAHAVRGDDRQRSIRRTMRTVVPFGKLRNEPLSFEGTHVRRPLASDEHGIAYHQRAGGISPCDAA